MILVGGCKVKDDEICMGMRQSHDTSNTDVTFVDAHGNKISESKTLELLDYFKRGMTQYAFAFNIFSVMDRTRQLH